MSDLVATSLAHDTLQKTHDAQSQELALAQAQLFSLRKERAQSSKQHNWLHRELISKEDSHTQREQIAASQNRSQAARTAELEHMLKHAGLSIAPESPPHHISIKNGLLLVQTATTQP